MGKTSTYTGGIYLITHLRSGKVYVGQTNRFRARWRKHETDLAERRHHNLHLQKIWDEEGRQGIRFDVHEQLPDGLSALERQRWLYRRKLVTWEFYSKQSLALNIIRPEICETPEALAEYVIEEKQTRLATNASITEELQTVKAALSFAQKAAFQAQQEYDRRAKEVQTIKDLIKCNTGFRGFLFGKTTGKSIGELERELQAATQVLAKAEQTKNDTAATETRLTKTRRQLYASYPKNSDRRMRRMDMTMPFSGGKSRSRSRIR